VAGHEARELTAVREIAHAFLLADRPSDVQQFALDRVTPLLGASFSLVMQLGPDGELLRPVAQHEWPARHRHWIGALRVRTGDGPSGLAVAERRLVEVEDLFADPSLQVWYEVAEELGFRSIIAAPLETADGPIGAVTFYFADATCLTDEQRALVRAVADQLAAATDKSRRTDALRRANAALAEANAELEAQADAWSAAERARDLAEGIVVTSLLELANPPSHQGGDDGDDESAERLAAVHALASAAREYAQVTHASFAIDRADVEARTPLLDAVQGWRARAPMVPIHVDEPTVLLPTVRSDRAWLTRLLDLVVGLAACGAAVEGGSVDAGLRLGRGFIAMHVGWRGIRVVGGDDQLRPEPPRILQAALAWQPRDPFASARRSVTAVDFALAGALAQRLGGELRVEDGAAPHVQEITLVFPVDAGRE
jgi:GAF domain-containing protein